MLIIRKISLIFNRFLIVIGICLLPAISTFAKEKSDTLSFIHISDIHLIFSPSNYNSDWIKGRHNHFWENAAPFEQFFKSTPSVNRADFIAVTGDLVDFYEAETTEGTMMGTQIEQFQGLLNSITNSNVYLTLGNHDITSYPKGRYHQDNSGVARATWIKNVPSFVNGTYYSRLYDVGTTTYRLIFLDNAYFSGRKNKEHADFIIDQPQLDWLEAQLNESPKDKEIIFMHMPLPVIDKKDEDNLIDISYEDYAKRTNSGDMLDIIRQAKNSSVQMIVAGHWHINDIYKFTFSEDFKFFQVLTGAFGNDVNNWRFFQLTDSDIIISDPGTTNNKLVIPLK